jgi:hypothetical protein
VADAWLAYPWWEADQTPQKLSPIKCGYDPCELFAEPCPQAAAVRASRGLTEISAQDQAILAGTFELPPAAIKANFAASNFAAIKASDFAALARSLIFEPAHVAR